MQKRIHTLLFYTLLLSVYAGFFSVESFFNFEGQSEGKELTRQAFLLSKNQPSFKNLPTPIRLPVVSG